MFGSAHTARLGLHIRKQTWLYKSRLRTRQGLSSQLTPNSTRQRAEGRVYARDCETQTADVPQPTTTARLLHDLSFMLQAACFACTQEQRVLVR